MNLNEYITKEMARTGQTSRRAILGPLSVKCGVSYNTLASFDRGAKAGQYKIAKAIETATGGEVTIRELCE